MFWSRPKTLRRELRRLRLSRRQKALLKIITPRGSESLFEAMNANDEALARAFTVQFIADVKLENVDELLRIVLTKKQVHQFNTIATLLFERLTKK